MKKNIGLVVDTNACLDYFDYDPNIRIIRSRIHLNDDEFLDHIELDADDFYKRLKEDKSITPRTSQPPTQAFKDAYLELKAQGCDDIIVVTISQHMSGIYGSARVAAKDIEGVNVHVFDSRSVAFIEAKMILDAYDLIQHGHGVEDVLSHLAYVRDHNHVFIAVDTLAYLVKNGRLSNAQGFLGSMMKIKPLLHISKEGKVEIIEKIRTFSKALEAVIERFLTETEGKDVEPFIVHAANLEAKEYVESVLLSKRPEYKRIFSMPLTPAVGAHAGPGAIGLGYIEK